MPVGKNVEYMRAMRVLQPCRWRGESGGRARGTVGRRLGWMDEERREGREGERVRVRAHVPSPSLMSSVRSVRHLVPQTAVLAGGGALVRAVQLNVLDRVAEARVA